MNERGKTLCTAASLPHFPGPVLPATAVRLCDHFSQTFKRTFYLKFLYLQLTYFAMFSIVFLIHLYTTYITIIYICILSTCVYVPCVLLVPAYYIMYILYIARLNEPNAPLISLYLVSIIMIVSSFCKADSLHISAQLVHFFNISNVECCVWWCSGYLHH